MDTGPGIPELIAAFANARNGVGLTNIRERLGVLYGDEQNLRLENLEPTGLGVTICIPFERSSQEDT